MPGHTVRTDALARVKATWPASLATPAARLSIFAYDYVLLHPYIAGQSSLPMPVHYVQTLLVFSCLKKMEIETAAHDLTAKDAGKPNYLYELPKSFGAFWYGIKPEEKVIVCRMGVHGDGSCAYHSICAALNLEEYNSCTDKRQKEIAYGFRCSFRDGLTQDKLRAILQKSKSKSPVKLEAVEQALCNPKTWADETALRIVGDSLGINMIFVDTMKNKVYCGVHHDKALTHLVPTMVILWIGHAHFEPLALIIKVREHVVDTKILLDPKNERDARYIRALMARYLKQC